MALMDGNRAVTTKAAAAQSDNTSCRDLGHWGIPQGCFGEGLVLGFRVEVVTGLGRKG